MPIVHSVSWQTSSVVRGIYDSEVGISIRNLPIKCTFFPTVCVSLSWNLKVGSFVLFWERWSWRRWKLLKPAHLFPTPTAALRHTWRTLFDAISLLGLAHGGTVKYTVLKDMILANFWVKSFSDIIERVSVVITLVFLTLYKSTYIENNLGIIGIFC